MASTVANCAKSISLCSMNSMNARISAARATSLKCLTRITTAIRSRYATCLWSMVIVTFVHGSSWTTGRPSRRGESAFPRCVASRAAGAIRRTAADSLIAPHAPGARGFCCSRRERATDELRVRALAAVVFPTGLPTSESRKGTPTRTERRTLRLLRGARRGVACEDVRSLRASLRSSRSLRTVPRTDLRAARPLAKCSLVPERGGYPLHALRLRAYARCGSSRVGVMRERLRHQRSKGGIA